MRPLNALSLSGRLRVTTAMRSLTSKVTCGSATVVSLAHARLAPVDATPQAHTGRRRLGRARRRRSARGPVPRRGRRDHDRGRRRAPCPAVRPAHGRCRRGRPVGGVHPAGAPGAARCRAAAARTAGEHVGGAGGGVGDVLDAAGRPRVPGVAGAVRRAARRRRRRGPSPGRVARRPHRGRADARRSPQRARRAHARRAVRRAPRARARRGAGGGRAGRGPVVLLRRRPGRVRDVPRPGDRARGAPGALARAALRRTLGSHGRRAARPVPGLGDRAARLRRGRDRGRRRRDRAAGGVARPGAGGGRHRVDPAPVRRGAPARAARDG